MKTGGKRAGRDTVVWQNERINEVEKYSMAARHQSGPTEVSWL